MLKLIADNGSSIASKRYSAKQYNRKQLLEALIQRRAESKFLLKVNRERRAKGLEQLPGVSIW